MQYGIVLQRNSDDTLHDTSPILVVGGCRVASLVVFFPIQIASPNFGNLSQLQLSGHVKLKRFINASQPCLALLQRERQGGTGVFNTVQTGAYTEQRKNAKSFEQPAATKEANWFTSKAACSCDV